VSTPPRAAVPADAAGTPVLDVAREEWAVVAARAKQAEGYDLFDWLSAVDEPDGDPAGVDVVAHVADSRSTGGPRVRRLLLRTRVPDTDPALPSLTGVWRGAAWHERETFEMFGISFTAFDDGTVAGLRPLLLPDGFEGTPLRKSFVLAARVSRPWPGAKEPGESDTRGTSPGRRRTTPPGVPDPAAWGPREPGGHPGTAEPADA